MPKFTRLRGRVLWLAVGGFLAACSLTAALVESVEVRGTRKQLKLETRVGERFRPAAVHRDVRRLWNTGQFSDIRVESTEGDPVRIVFRVVESPRFLLREVRFDPPGERRKLSIQPGDPTTEVAARAAGQSLEVQLISEGFPRARVQAGLIRAGSGEADLAVSVERGAKARFAKVDFEGTLGLDPARLRQALRATGSRRWLPGIPGIWKGWVHRAPYSPGRIESDLAAVRSLYITEGYLAATVSARPVRFDENGAALTVLVDAGPRYHIVDTLVETPLGRWSFAAPVSTSPSRGGHNTAPLDRRKLCRCLLEKRSKAEREGRLDFMVRLEWTPVDSPARHVSKPADGSPANSHRVADERPAQREARLVAQVDPGPQYRVGRIEFRGNKTLRDGTLRRALAIEEGDWLDPAAIQSSIDRLSRIEMIESVSDSDVQARPGASGGVDLTFTLRERKHGRWSVSGPLGPIRWFGPLRLAIDTRLPPWGRGIVDLSTWLGTFGIVSYTDPVAQILSGNTKGLWLPFAALRRPLLPGQEWTSGFLLSPSLGWKDHLLYAGVLHARARVDNALVPPVRDTAPLAATYGRGGSDNTTFRQPGVLLCKPHASRLAWLRAGAKLLLNLTMGAS